MRIKKQTSTKYFYALSRSDASIVRRVGVVGLLALLPMVVGFYLFASQSQLIFLTSLPFYIIVTVYLFMSYFMMSLYPSFDITAHKKRVAAFRKKSVQPKVAVFIPVAGENIAMVQKTVKAATKMKYANFTVFILDDSNDAMYRNMAKENNVVYYRRKRIGFEKKAGNLNAAIKRIRGFEYFLVLDADFIPRPEMISELIPYAYDEVAVVQSPQHFDLDEKVYKRSKIEHGAGIIQQNFYRITQPARNRFGAAICVGTNALYSVSALRKVNGFEGVGDKAHAQAEDVHTGLKLLHATHRNGKRYKISYIPIQLAKGKCPDDHQSFYKQQNRWATGSLQLMITTKTLFSRKLTFMQRLFYVTGPIHYLYTISFLFLPIQLLIVLLSGANFSQSNTILFIPVLVISILAVPYLLRSKVNILSTSIVTISNAYTFLQVLCLLMIGRPLGWEASGVKNKKKSSHFSVFKIVGGAVFLSIHLTTFAILILNDANYVWGGVVLVGLFLFSFITHLIYLCYMLLNDIHISRIHLKREFYAYTSILLIVSLAGFNSFTYKSSLDVAFSKSSLIAVVPEEKPLENRPANTIDNSKKPQVFPAITVTAEQNDSNWTLASKAVHKMRSVYVMPDGQAGKLHDRLLQEVNYDNNLAVGQSYSYSHEKILELLKLAYVYPEEQEFWDNYAYLASVR